VSTETYVKSLRGKGFFLSLQGGRIMCQPLNQPMTDSELAELRERKPKVLPYLVQRLAEDLEHKHKVLANARQTYERYGGDWPSIEKRWREEHIPKIQINIARMQAELALFGVTIDDPLLNPIEATEDEPAQPVLSPKFPAFGSPETKNDTVLGYETLALSDEHDQSAM
jgi:hypothetical protein